MATVTEGNNKKKYEQSKCDLAYKTDCQHLFAPSLFTGDHLDNVACSNLLIGTRSLLSHCFTAGGMCRATAEGDRPDLSARFKSRFEAH